MVLSFRSLPCPPKHIALHFSLARTGARTPKLMADKKNEIIMISLDQWFSVYVWGTLETPRTLPVVFLRSKLFS